MGRWSRRATQVAAALVLVGASAVAGATAAWAESIRDFTVDVQVYPDTAFQVTERITYDFEGEYRHGIFRDIPQYDETVLGSRRTYGVDIVSVTMDGGQVPYEVSDNGPYLNVKIGDPNVTITGPHQYVITYTVRDGLRVVTADDAADPQAPSGISAGDVELYWDFVGTGWDVPITSARAAVVGPPGIIAAKCYFGPSGATTPCTAAAASAAVALGPVGLAAGDALTGSIVWPASAFTRAPRENLSQGMPSNPAVGFLGALIPAALIVLIPVGVAVSRRRSDAGAPVPGAPCSTHRRTTCGPPSCTPHGRGARAPRRSGSFSPRCWTWLPGAGSISRRTTETCRSTGSARERRHLPPGRRTSSEWS